MHSYNSRMFRPLANTNLGKQLWIFLNDDIIVACMKTATYLGKPSVSGIEENLLDKFQKEVVDDRVKQMIGHMIRQIMEDNGYIVEKRNVIIGSILFSKGTRYTRPEWQHLYVFRSSKNRYELCFTTTRDTTDLPDPDDNGKWRFWASFSSILHGCITYGINIEGVRRDVAKDGFALRMQERLPCAVSCAG